MHESPEEFNERIRKKNAIAVSCVLIVIAFVAVSYLIMKCC